MELAEVNMNAQPESPSDPREFEKCFLNFFANAPIATSTDKEGA
jgi:hypothetical protein